MQQRPTGERSDAFQRLDGIAPRDRPEMGSPDAALPVYVYFHGGGWTSDDEAVPDRPIEGLHPAFPRLHRFVQSVPGRLQVRARAS